MSTPSTIVERYKQGWTVTVSYQKPLTQPRCAPSTCCGPGGCVFLN
jgi:hypothetical protein